VKLLRDERYIRIEILFIQRKILARELVRLCLDPHEELPPQVGVIRFCVGAREFLLVEICACDFLALDGIEDGEEIFCSAVYRSAADPPVLVQEFRPDYAGMDGVYTDLERRKSFSKLKRKGNEVEFREGVRAVSIIGVFKVKVFEFRVFGVGHGSYSEDLFWVNLAAGEVTCQPIRAQSVYGKRFFEPVWCFVADREKCTGIEDQATQGLCRFCDRVC